MVAYKKEIEHREICLVIPDLSHCKPLCIALTSCEQTNKALSLAHGSPTSVICRRMGQSLTPPQDLTAILIPKGPYRSVSLASGAEISPAVSAAASTAGCGGLVSADENRINWRVIFMKKLTRGCEMDC